MRPLLFQIGDFKVYSFGLMAALALIVPGITIVRPLVRRRGVSGDFAYELIVAAGIGGFVGARIYYMIENWSTVQRRVLEHAVRRHRLHLVRRPHRRLRRRRRLDAHPQDAAGHHRQRHGAGHRVRLPHRPHRLPAGRRRRLRQAVGPAVGHGLPERHRAHPARRARPPHAHLRDHHHGVRDLDPVAPGDALRQVRLVDVRLVPGALGRRALLRRVPAPQPGLVRRPHAAAVGGHRERAHRRRR